MRHRSIALGLVIVQGLVLSLTERGGNAFTLDSRVNVLSRQAPSQATLAGAPPLKVNIFTKEDLANQLDDGSRDLVAVMQRLEALDRNSLKLKIKQLTAAYPLPPQKKTLFESSGIKRFFTGLFAPKPKKEMGGAAGIKLAPAATAPRVTAWAGFASKAKLPVYDEKASVEREKARLVSVLRGLVDQAFGLVPDDAKIRSGDARLEPSDISLLGATLNVVAALRMADMKEALGFKGFEASPQCANVIWSDMKEDNQRETSSLSRYFKFASRKFIADDRENENIAEAQYALAKVQQGLNCFSLKDLSVVDFQTARALIALNFGLWASGKGYAAKALVENYLPAGLLVWNAAKSFKIPETLRVLYLEGDYSSLRRDGFAFSALRLTDREDGGLDVKIGGEVIATLARVDNESAADLKARYAASGDHFPLVRSLLADADRSTFRWLGGALAPYPWREGTPLVAVNLRGRSYSDLFQSFLDFPGMGEGDCSLHEMADNNFICQSQTTCRILQGAGLRSRGASSVGGAIGAFFAGFASQPGGSLSGLTTFGVARSSLGDFCGHGSGGSGGAGAPSAGASLACVMPTGFNGIMNKEMGNMLNCAVKVTREGQARNFQVFTSLGRQSGFRCHMSPLMQDGGRSSPADRTERERMARGAVDMINRLYGERGELSQGGGGSVADGLAGALNAEFGAGSFSAEDGQNLWQMGLLQAQEEYEAGDISVSPEDTGNVYAVAAAIDQEAQMIAVSLGEVWHDTRADTSGVGGAGASGGTHGPGEGTSNPSGTESTEHPTEDENPPERGSDLANPTPPGSSQCAPEEAGSCSESCSYADEMLRSFSDCIDGGNDHPVDRCAVTPDGCGDTRTGQSSLIDPLAACLSSPPPLGSAAGCVNVYCADSDPNCCGAAAGAGSGGDAGLSNPNPGGRPSPEGGNSFGPILNTPGGHGPVDIQIPVNLPPTPTENQ